LWDAATAVGKSFCVVLMFWRAEEWASRYCC